VDRNSAYTLDDLPMFRELDEYHLAMIEQPLAHDDLLDHASLQKITPTPVCLDESIVSVEKARKAIEAKACQWVNIKVGRVGGLTSALAIKERFDRCCSLRSQPDLPSISEAQRCANPRRACCGAAYRSISGR